jgi:hypothetical protein
LCGWGDGRRCQNTACIRIHQSQHIHRRHRMFPNLQPDGLFAKDLHNAAETHSHRWLQLQPQRPYKLWTL